jgi:uncharacterized membrane protein YedE/YeeE
MDETKFVLFLYIFVDLSLIHSIFVIGEEHKNMLGEVFFFFFFFLKELGLICVMLCFRLLKFLFRKKKKKKKKKRMRWVTVA